MQLFYSGAVENRGKQNNSQLSLGGFISQNRIPNGGLNNLFPTISKRHIKEQISDTRLIVLTNNESQSINSLSLFIQLSDTSLCTYEIALVSPAINNACKCEQFESIDNGEELPYQAEFTTANSDTPLTSTAAILTGKSVGVWIKRSINLSKFNELDGTVDALSNSDLITLLQSEQSSGQQLFDDAQLVIDYTLAGS